MGLDRCPKDLPGLMNLTNNYITDILKKQNLRKTSGKYQTGVAFNQTQNMDKNGKKRQTSMVSPIASTLVNIITGNHHSLNFKTDSVDRYIPTLGPRNMNKMDMKASQEWYFSKKIWIPRLETHCTTKISIWISDIPKISLWGVNMKQRYTNL